MSQNQQLFRQVIMCKRRFVPSPLDTQLVSSFFYVLTTDPWMTKRFCILAESEAVMRAVNIAIILIPITIQITQNIRPRIDLGALSPYLQTPPNICS